ncbi:unnamed protein product [Rangifer tarandus platyrhynchus]|uniref:Uncharacterized protein n=1 Tax=Rangifer tarandus platyrhynchus TaxID=3082113 RepID=A0ABN8YGY6_RANTA|nr:unnamed protein product [Rangifer tarandus platyrhynchus]
MTKDMHQMQGTVAAQALLSIGFSRQQYWRGLPFLPPRDLPDPGIESASLMSPALVGGFFTTSTTWKALCYGHKANTVLTGPKSRCEQPLGENSFPAFSSL